MAKNESKTVGEFIKRRLKREKVWRLIIIAIFVGMVILAVCSLIFDNPNFIIAFIFALYPSVGFLIFYADRYIPTLTNQKWLKKIGCEHVAEEMVLEQAITPKSKIYAGNDVLVCKRHGLIIPYDEVVWAYMYERRVNGIRVESYLAICTKLGKKIPLHGKPKELEIVVFEYLIHKNPSVMLGYGKEQKTNYKAIVKSYKDTKETQLEDKAI